MKNLRSIVLAMVLLLILLAGMVLYFRQEVSQQAVVKQIQGLNRLETVAYTMEKIVAGGKSSGALMDLLFGDKMLFIANGRVIAGIDLSSVTEEDVSITKKDIYIRLPAPQIFFVTIDNNKSSVYDRTTGLFTKGNKDLETKVRTDAEAILRTTACDDGILDRANEQAVKHLTSLFKALHYDMVTIETHRGICK